MPAFLPATASSARGHSRERLGSTAIAGAWLLRLPPGASFWQQPRQARLSRLLGWQRHAVYYLFWLLAWWMSVRARSRADSTGGGYWPGRSSS